MSPQFHYRTIKFPPSYHRVFHYRVRERATVCFSVRLQVNQIKFLELEVLEFFRFKIS
jgi:hypothetical protein